MRVAPAGSVGLGLGFSKGVALYAHHFSRLQTM